MSSSDAGGWADHGMLRCPRRDSSAATNQASSSGFARTTVVETSARAARARASNDGAFDLPTAHDALTLDAQRREHLDRGEKAPREDAEARGFAVTFDDRGEPPCGITPHRRGEPDRGGRRTPLPMA